MSINSDPHFIVPSETLKTFSGRVLFHTTFGKDLLKKELEELGYEEDLIRGTIPCDCRKERMKAWIKIGE